MPRGFPDFGITEQFGKELMPTDIAELAARLGSIVTFDRRGKIAEIESFEGPVLLWLPTTVALADLVILDSTSVKSGSQAVYLARAPLWLAQCLMSRRVAILESKILGLEFSFSDMASDMQLYHYLSWQSATARYEAAVQIVQNTGQVSVRDHLGAWQLVTDTAGFLQEAFSFATIKMVANFETNMFIRLMVNDEEFDISTIALRWTGAGAAPNLLMRFELDSALVAGGDVWIDDVILTYDEPPT